MTNIYLWSKLHLMKTYSLGGLICLLFLMLICAGLKAQTSAVSASAMQGPWLKSQLIEPAELAAMIRSGKLNGYKIFNIGAVEDIKDAMHIGAASKEVNLENFRKALGELPKSSKIIIYCGCCPFTKCPNVGPAYETARKLGFVNIKILDLPVNLKTNWISKGYPLAGETSAN